MGIKGKKIGMLIEQDFEDVEVSKPLEELKKAGAVVTLIGSGSSDTYSGKHNRERFTPDTTAGKVSADEFDAIVIPGGYAPDKMRLHHEMVELVEKAQQSGKLIAALCHGPQLLISAGIVKGRQVTSWPSVAVDLKNAGAEWVDKPVVRDGNLITSRKPDDIPAFDRAIIEALS